MYIQDLVQSQAKARPDAIAVVAGKQQLSYGELESRANELACFLQSHGIGANVVVALCMQRSPALIVAALGILKAGAAYLPIDPTDPAKRVGSLLEDARCTLVLTESRIAEALPRGNWKIVALDENGCLPSCSERLTTLTENPGELAYVIFTSGSTGRPKGVQISHANLLNLVRWHIRNFEVACEDKATMHASPGFDASVWEIWPYLAAGATICVVDDAVRTAPESLRNWMVASGITISFIPTAIAESLITLPWPAETSLRLLLTGADTLHRYPRPDVPFALVNNYGPTECTVVATSGVIEPQVEPNILPTIGKPIDRVRVYIVDEQLKKVPNGESGELLIGGAGVGRGYLNLDELTAQRFIRDPFSRGDGSRVYRTGDLVRRLPDGQIMFLGRVDEQLKIRGYRIEPGEISAVLNRQPGIEASFVAGCADEGGDPRLVAYLVTNSDAGVRAGQLRDCLAECLPAYMVPSVFIRLSSLPLTKNGKVDRSALPDPTPANILVDGKLEPPQSAIEQWLAELLKTLLGVPCIGRTDNFFRLGGHSLLGAQLIAEIDQRFGVELSLRSLFDHPTMQGIASEIDSLIRAELNAMSDEEAQRVLQSLPGGIAA
jgi:amino acid adenylation domain-containing protein